MKTNDPINKHKEWLGKIEISSRVKIESKSDLGIAYTPGVASVCLAIEENPKLSFELTRRGQMIAVITDGTAVLGLGDIGPLASMPVMEGKALLFKTFGHVDAVPLCIDTKDVDEFVKIVSSLQYNFGGINLEDISAPRCFEIEQKLNEICDIPVFHDDQHGTAIVVGAALINSAKLIGKKLSELKVVINGAGAAGLSIANFLDELGCKDIILCDRYGIIMEEDETSNRYQKDFAKNHNPRRVQGLLKDALVGADAFIGVSKGNIVTKEMIQSMSTKPICFPLANPVPEISYDEAKSAGAFIVGTGSSLFPNQINNVLAFPGIFRGALDIQAKKITKKMMMTSCYAIANTVTSEELNEDYILPDPLDRRVHENIINEIKKTKS